MKMNLGDKVPDFQLPTASGETWNLKAGDGHWRLLIFLRHLG